MMRSTCHKKGAHRAAATSKLYKTNPERLLGIVRDESNLEEWKRIEKAYKNAEKSFISYGLGNAQQASQEIIKEHNMTNEDWEIAKRVARLGAELEAIGKTLESVKRDYVSLWQIINKSQEAQDEKEEE